MTEHQKLLQAVFQGLDETARIAFLKETLASLDPAQRQKLLETDKPLINSQESAAMPQQDHANPPSGAVESAVAVTGPPSAKTPTIAPQAVQKPQPDPSLLPEGIVGLDPEKSQKVMAALSQFQLLKENQGGNQKKVLRKEVFSCLGLGLLALAVLVIASVGLKYLWQTLFP